MSGAIGSRGRGGRRGWRAAARLAAALVLLGPAAVGEPEPEGARDRGPQQEEAAEPVPDGPLAEAVAALDAPTAAAREAALARLVAADRAGRRTALAAPRPRTASGRRAFVRFAAAAGVAEAVAPLVALTRDPDAVVRRRAVGGLGRVDLGAMGLAERIGALAAAARDDADPDVRAAALAALGELDHPDGAAVLAGVVADGGPQAVLAARALVRLASGDGAVARLLEDAVAGRASGPDDDRVLTALLGGYGPALARGASSPEVGARVLAGLAASAAPKRNAAAAAALTDALATWDRLGVQDGARAFLAALTASGWSEDALDHAVAQRALGEDGRPARALAAGERLERRHRATRGTDGARAAADGLVYQAAALLVQERTDEARERLARAAALLEGAAAARPDLGARPLERHAGRAEVAVDVLQRLANARLFDVVAAVAQGADPFDPDVLATARAAHLAALRAQVVGLRGDSDAWVGSLEAVLGRRLAPASLLAPLSRGDRAPVWLERIGRALAALEAVSGHELPGFVEAIEGGRARVAAAPERLTDPLADPERLELLRAMRIADLERVSMRVVDPNERANRRLWQLAEARLLEKIAADEEQDWAPLLDYRAVSTAALTHAERWRGAGDGERALRHALALRAVTRDAPNAPSGAFGTLFGARVALAVGTARTDLDQGEEAERELLDARARLEAYENELTSRLADLEQGRLGAQQLAAVDPFERRRTEQQLEATRDLRAQVYVSLAVNANVRLGDLEGAMAWFEKAYELRQDDFMRVLSACYAARAGRDEQARFTLASVTPTRDLQYNLACTYALLGESERALAHLATAIEGLPGPGARARQARWARDDPDFASLTDDPRFEALLARFER